MTPAEAKPADLDVARLVCRVEAELGTWSSWPGGWPKEADTALIDAVYSTRARYDTVVRPLVARYQAWPDRPLDGTLQTLLDVDRDELLRCLANQQRVPGGIALKVDAVIETAGRLICHGLNSPSDIRTAAGEDTWRVRRLLQQTGGIGPATSNYFLMLIGIDGVKADTLVTAFVDEAISRSTTPEECERLVGEAASYFGRSRIELDHAIWRHESDRRRHQRNQTR